MNSILLSFRGPRAIQRHMAALTDRLARVRFSRTRQLAFLALLFRLVDDGVPLREALEALSQMPGCQWAAASVGTALARGQSLGEAMSPVLDADLAGAVAVAERSEAMADRGLALVESIQRQDQTRASALGVLVMPAVYVVLALLAVMYLSLELFPLLETMRPLAAWPPDTRSLYGLGQHLQRFGGAYVVAALVLGLAVRWAEPRWGGALRRTLDHYYPLSLVREALSARVQQQLALRLQAGAELNDALGQQWRGAQGHERAYIEAMRARQRQGVDLGTLLDVGLLHPGDLAQLKALAAHRGFNTALARLGEEALVRTTARLRVAVQPLRGLLLVITAILLLRIAQAILSLSQGV